MKIEDIKIGDKVKLISTENTEKVLGYGTQYMTFVGDVLKVESFGTGPQGCVILQLSDGYYYSALDLEPYETKSKLLSNVTVNISIEDKEEIAKDILGMVLVGLNEVISDAIQSLQNPVEVYKEKEPKKDLISGEFFERYFTESKMTELLDEALKTIIVEQFRDVTRDLNSKAFGI